MLMLDNKLYGNMTEAQRFEALTAEIKDTMAGASPAARTAFLTAIGASPVAIPAATASVVGGVKKAATVANATDAATVITQLNALLTSLRTAGTIT